MVSTIRLIQKESRKRLRKPVSISFFTDSLILTLSTISSTFFLKLQRSSKVHEKKAQARPAYFLDSEVPAFFLVPTPMVQKERAMQKKKYGDGNRKGFGKP